MGDLRAMARLLDLGLIVNKESSAGGTPLCAMSARGVWMLFTYFAIVVLLDYEMHVGRDCAHHGCEERSSGSY